MPEYIYLLQEREFIKAKENIYKLGMTKKENLTRFNQYPKGSLLLSQIICNNSKYIEKILISKFKETFKQKKDIGNEYFEGEYNIMIDIIYYTIKNVSVISIEEDEHEDKDIVEEDEDEDIVEEDDDEDIVEEDEDEDNVEKKIENYRKNIIKRIKSKKYQEKAFKIVCDKIHNTFPDYKQDTSFGGTKKFIIITEFNSYEYFVHYINPELKSLIYSDDGDTYWGPSFYDNLTEDEAIHKNFEIICKDNIRFECEEEKIYFNMMIRDKIIITNTIYDLYSKSFAKKLLTTKMKINIDNYTDFINTHEIIIKTDIEKNIKNYLSYNLIINDKIFASIDTDIFEKHKKIKDFDDIRINMGKMDNKNYTLIYLHKINKKYYDYKSFLRKYIPYVIRWNANKDYYILNRDYEYIGINSKSIDDKCKGQENLFDDATKPWDNKNNYTRLCIKYKKIIKDNSLNDCLNMHNSTETILTLLN